MEKLRTAVRDAKEAAEAEARKRAEELAQLEKRLSSAVRGKSPSGPRVAVSTGRGGRAAASAAASELPSAPFKVDDLLLGLGAGGGGGMTPQALREARDADLTPQHSVEQKKK